VWTPNLRGVITTHDGKEILVAIHGQSVEENAPGHQRAILARVELTTEEGSYRWLNTCFLIGEGEIDEEREVWWLLTYVCVNEEAHGPRRSAPNHPSGSARDRGSAWQWVPTNWRPTELHADLVQEKEALVSKCQAMFLEDSPVGDPQARSVVTWINATSDGGEPTTSSWGQRTVRAWVNPLIS
jgi:hypothetical protein